MKNRKILIIGVDGGEWNLINKWIDNLPNFKHVKENGMWGYLESTILPVTVPAWPAFYTGKNPGKMGVYHFEDLSRNDYSVTIVKPESVKSISFFKLLSIKNLRYITINLPNYFEKLSTGIVVLSAVNSIPKFHPLEIENEIEKICGKYEPPSQDFFKNPEMFVEKIYEHIEKFKTIVKYLLTQKKWDLFFFHYGYTDFFQHYFWKYMVDLEKNEKYKNAIFEMYKIADDFMGELFKLIDLNNTTIFVMSDHGADYYDLSRPIGTFHVNDWLCKNGFQNLKYKISIWSLLAKFGITKDKIYKTLLSFGIDLKRHLSPQRIKKELDANEFIDWKNTKAYLAIAFSNYGGIRINLEGREKLGTVKKEEYEKVRGAIISLLKEMKTPDGKPLIRKIWKSEELYSGKYLYLAPDIVFETDKNFPPRKIISYGRVFSEKMELNGFHRLRGIFLAYGPDIKTTGEEIKNLKIYDIAPTILHMFNLPIPNDMDGRILLEIFKEDSEIAKRKPVYVEPSYYEEKLKSISEKERIRERVRELKEKNKV